MTRARRGPCAPQACKGTPAGSRQQRPFCSGAAADAGVCVLLLVDATLTGAVAADAVCIAAGASSNPLPTRCICAHRAISCYSVNAGNRRSHPMSKQCSLSCPLERARGGHMQQCQVMQCRHMQAAAAGSAAAAGLRRVQHPPSFARPPRRPLPTRRPVQARLPTCFACVLQTTDQPTPAPPTVHTNAHDRQHETTASRRQTDSVVQPTPHHRP
jgi:hypothetical protein